MKQLSYYQIYVIDENNKKVFLDISFKNEDDAKSFIMIKRSFNSKINIGYDKQSTTVYESVEDYASRKQQKIEFSEK